MYYECIKISLLLCRNSKAVFPCLNFWEFLFYLKNFWIEYSIQFHLYDMKGKKIKAGRWANAIFQSLNFPVRHEQSEGQLYSNWCRKLFCELIKIILRHRGHSVLIPTEQAVLFFSQYRLQAYRIRLAISFYSSCL